MEAIASYNHHSLNKQYHPLKEPGKTHYTQLYPRVFQLRTQTLGAANTHSLKYIKHIHGTIYGLSSPQIYIIKFNGIRYGIIFLNGSIPTYD